MPGAGSGTSSTRLTPSTPATVRRSGSRWGPNRFSCSGYELDLDDDEGRVTGSAKTGPWRSWPVRWTSLGIMGWYRFVPGMVTYHGVLSMDHAVCGPFSIGGETLDLDGGRGYVEKDWGTRFPSSWVWMQTNTFEAEDGSEMVGASLTLSVGKVPFMTGRVRGLHRRAAPRRRARPLHDLHGRWARLAEHGRARRRWSSRTTRVLTVRARGQRDTVGLLKRCRGAPSARDEEMLNATVGWSCASADAAAGRGRCSSRAQACARARGRDTPRGS